FINEGTERMYEFFRKVKEEQMKPGQKRELVAKISNKDTKRVRKRSEMFDLQDEIQNKFGNNLGTRAIAWCAGEITEDEFIKSVEDYGKIPSRYKMEAMRDDIIMAFGKESVYAKIAGYYMGELSEWELKALLKKVQVENES